jgi:hypothetical protein
MLARGDRLVLIARNVPLHLRDGGHIVRSMLNSVVPINGEHL